MNEMNEIERIKNNRLNVFFQKKNFYFFEIFKFSFVSNISKLWKEKNINGNGDPPPNPGLTLG